VQRTIYVLRRSAEGLRSAINDLHLEEERDRPFPALVKFVVQRSRARAWGCEITLEVRERGSPRRPLGRPERTCRQQSKR
jgi:hypothetical protein